MIKCDGAELKITGNIETTIGPELVQIIGGIYDALRTEVGDAEAGAFIDICVNSALLRMPDEMKAKVDEKARQMEHLTEDEILKHFGFCQ